MTITVPLVPPSANALRRQYRNVFAYKRLRDSWEYNLRYAVPNAATIFQLRKQGRGKVRVKITIYHAGRYDPDNLVASCKPVLDALRNVGYIHDDSHQWLELLPTEQLSSGRTSKTTIEIEAI